MDTSRDLEKHSADELSRQANEYQKEDRYEEAVALYEQALTLDRARADDWVNRGLSMVFEAQGGSAGIV